MRLIFLVRVTTPKLPLYSKFWSIYSVTLLQNEKFYEIGSIWYWIEVTSLDGRINEKDVEMQKILKQNWSFKLYQSFFFLLISTFWNIFVQIVTLSFTNEVNH